MHRSKNNQTMTKSEVAERLQICIRTLDKHIGDGPDKLKPIRLGPRLIRFDVREVERFEKALTQPASAREFA